MRGCIFLVLALASNCSLAQRYNVFIRRHRDVVGGSLVNTNELLGTDLSAIQTAVLSAIKQEHVIDSVVWLVDHQTVCTHVRRQCIRRR